MDGIHAHSNANGNNFHARGENAPEDHANNQTGPTTGDAPATPMSLTFRDQSGFALTFKLRATTRLGKAVDHFAAKSEKARETLRFLFEGDRIIPDSTPEDVGLEDGDVIEVHMEQIGGGAE